MEPSKLFMVVRADLSPGAQLAQSTHAAVAFAFTHPDAARSWHAASNNLVALAAPDREALERIHDRAICAPGVMIVRFHEPDFDGALTAIALHGDGAGKLLSNLPLALRPARVPVAA
jgi:hypothetical protein